MMIRPLPALNDNYNPPRPWQCMTPAAHACTGEIVGALGAYPVCESGGVAEQAARNANAERIARLMDAPEMRREVARERAFERRYS